MLVIRRRSNESFFLGDEIEILVLEVKGSHVKLGIQAPKSIQVLRREVLETREANRAAARTEIPEAFISRLIRTPEK